MAHKYYENILAGLKDFFSSQGLTASPDAPEIYLNDKKAVRIDYDDQRHLFLLKAADIEEGQPVEFRQLSSYLFDDSHGPNDAKAVAYDFEESLQKEFGVKKGRAAGSSQAELPSKAVKGETPNVEALANRFLTLFPQFKDAYKEHVAEYGELLYGEFFLKTAAPHLRTLAEDKNKKALAKYFAMLEELYAEGDKNVAGTITYVIIGGAFGPDLALYDSMKDYMADCKYLRPAGRAMVEYLKTHKKELAALKK